MRTEAEPVQHSHRFLFIVLTPAGEPNPSLAIAASRAGSLGVLNLEFARDQAAALEAVEQLRRHGRSPFGVLLHADNADLLAAVTEAAGSQLDCVIFASVTSGLADTVRAVHECGARAYLVVRSLEDALAGRDAGVDAVIAKGHEAGGWIGEETAFVLLQHLAGRIELPIYAYGGIGLHTAAACFVAGAAGAVLDSQLLLTRESPLDETARGRVANMDGSETAVIGSSLGAPFRCFWRPDVALVEEMRQREVRLHDLPSERAGQEWRQKLAVGVDWRHSDCLWALGQDASFAAGLASRFRTVAGVIAGLKAAITEHVDKALVMQPLAEGSPLAISHGTRFPIVQGPMTRVSDRAPFARAVADAGALPFLALALMRKDEIRGLLEETRTLLAERPWGVGILGFVPQELRTEQLEVVREARPPFALIAGGRPEQARALEAEGIATYLHVPSPGLLQMFLEDGATRFVFEGRECGGHVGPRTSFVLWESMVEVLQRFQDASKSKRDFHVLFAGGIHDGLSAAMVAALSATLADRGVRVGVLMGTSYLFTNEAVACGAIQAGFQNAALDCDETVLLEAGPGYATRCLPSPFVDAFAAEKRRLQRDGVAGEQLKEQLESLNIGRLRIASKGVDHNPLYGKEEGAPRLLQVEAPEQWQQGMYMIGQVAALRNGTCSLEEMHSDVSAGSSRCLQATSAPITEEEPAPPPPAAVAIVGMASILPGAPDLKTFWSNILNKVDSVREVPPERWDPAYYYDPEKSAPDKVYSRWGGFIDEVPFDALEFGMPPNSLLSIEPYQLLALAVVRDALGDAGYLERPFKRERTSVILGAGGGGPDLTTGYVVRSSLPALFGDMAPKLTERLKGVLPEWTEDSFPGLLMNVAAGRVANRFDFGGVNYTVDAACASSLAATYLAVRDLEARTSDVVVVGGVDAIQNPFGFLCFSKTQALSPNGRSRPFDDESDGIAISEGFGAIVLKRLEDAERDGDRIYAVIRGAGGSSDGRDRGLTAPRPEGQMRAFQRAYAQAGYSPASVGLIEAHGTGTVAGDQAEVESLTRIFEEAGAGKQTTAIGSVKSMIGHTKATAGVAGLIKVAKALHHRVLPPTLGVTRPNSRANFPQTPLYVNSETRPWIQAPSLPRRAGVSAFGFGGTNFHITLEEYSGSFLPEQEAALDPWPAELFLWRGGSAAELQKSVEELRGRLEEGAAPALADLAFTLLRRAEAASSKQACLAIVAESLEQLRERMSQACDLLHGNPEREHSSAGIHFSRQPLAQEGKLAFLFPGQGSQYVNMARELAIAFPEVRETFDRADELLATRLDRPLSGYIFPPPSFSKEEEKARQEDLTETNIAQPALGVTDLALLRLLRGLGVQPDMTAGHSYGEFVAMHAAGVFDEEALLALSEARGRFMKEGVGADSGAMAAISAPREALTELVDGTGVVLANLNSPRQTVVSGPTAAVEEAIAWCKQRDLSARRLIVGAAFHSPLVAPAQKRLAEVLSQTAMQAPRIAVYANTTALPYPVEPGAVAALLAEHLARPVEWTRQMEAMHEAGARIFVEVGPRQTLTGLADQILAGKDYLSVPLDVPNRPGLVQFLNAAALLLSEGVSLDAQRFFRGRGVRRLDLSRLNEEPGAARPTPTTWMVSGGGVRPPSGRTERAPLPLRIQLLEDSAPSSVSVPKAEPSRTLDTAEAAGGPQITAPVPPAPAISEAASAAIAAGEPSFQTKPLPAPGAALPEGSMPAAGASGAETAAVMEHFQRVMQRFLQVQENVMLGLLAGASPAASEAPVLQTPAMNMTAAAGLPPDPPAATVPGAPARMENAEAAPGEARGVEDTAVVEPESAEAPTITREAIARELLAIVSDRTGYPAEALALEADLEADLGVDSIKRVEIAGAILRALAPHFREQPEAERLTACRSLNQLIDQLEALTGEHSTAVSAVEGPAGKPVTTEQAASGPVLERAQIAAQLVAMVSDRTGYPVEALALDADLEADLGIDSIKRVEIAGAMLRALGPHFREQPEVEGLTACRSLNQLIDQLEALAAGGSSGRGAPLAASAMEGPSSSEKTSLNGAEPARDHASPAAPAAVQRYLLRVVPAAPASRNAGLERSGVVVILDDETGVGEGMAAALEREGYTAVRLVSSEPSGGAGYFVTDDQALANPGALLEWLHTKFGRASALVNLTALRPQAQRRVTPGAEDTTAAMEGFFNLTKALHADLEAAAAAGGAAILVATSMGGAFGCDEAAVEILPRQAWLAGFVKSVAWEWPSVRARAVDLQVDTADRLAQRLLDELFSADELRETGYRKDGDRLTLKLQPQDLPAAISDPGVDRSSVVLVTGGARGITAETALALAVETQATLVLVGRTPAPDGDEPAETAGITEERELKKALFERRRAAGTTPRPAEIEDSYRQLLRQREVRAVLDRFASTGARVAYLTCDVQDPAAFAALIDDVYETYGRIDGVLHGAGTIEDRLLDGKSFASFRRVFETKVTGAEVLAARLRPESLRFLVFFSSVSGRFGNRGQADYAAANEVLNKLAQRLDASWPGRVVAMNWGPWQSAGMVTAEAMRQFAEKGISLIPVETGCRMLLQELSGGRKGQAEVLIAGLGKAAEPYIIHGANGHGNGAAGNGNGVKAPNHANGHRATAAPLDLPLLENARLSRGPAGEIEAARVFSTKRDLYLPDHLLDGRPVVPFAVVLELIAEVAKAGWPHFDLLDLRDTRALSGLVLESPEKPVRVVVRPRPVEGGSDTASQLVLDALVLADDGSNRMHYKSVVEMGRLSLPHDGIESTLPYLREGSDLVPKSIESLYDEWLFHGPLLQAIESIDFMGPRGAHSTLRASAPSACIAGARGDSWLIDPVVVDAAFQVQLIWTRTHWDATLLPACVRGLRPLLSAEGGVMGNAGSLVSCELITRPEADFPISHTDFVFRDAGGRALAVLTDLEASGSKALNRLAGTVRRVRR